MVWWPWAIISVSSKPCPQDLHDLQGRKWMRPWLKCLLYAVCFCPLIDFLLEKIDSKLPYAQISTSVRKVLLSLVFLLFYSFTSIEGQGSVLFIVLLPMWLILFFNDNRKLHYSEAYGSAKRFYSPMQYKIYLGVLILFQVGIGLGLLTNLYRVSEFAYGFVMVIFLILGVDAFLQVIGKFYKSFLHDNPMRKILTKATIGYYLLAVFNHIFQVVHVSSYLYMQGVLILWFLLIYSDRKSYLKAIPLEDEEKKMCS